MRQIIINSCRVAFVALITTGTFAGGGYLPKIGPAALRVKAEPAVVDLAKVLPPLAMDDEPVTEAEVPVEMSGAPLGPLMPTQPGGEPQTVQSSRATVPEPISDAGEQMPPQQAPLTPQMFMRFFNQSGGSEAIVETPVQFTPHAPSRGSSASYIVK